MSNPIPTDQTGQNPVHLPTMQEVQSWLAGRIADMVYMNAADIDLQADFNSFGLSSREAVLLSGDLEEWLGIRLSPTLLYEYPSVEKLAAHLATAKPGSSADQPIEINPPPTPTPGRSANEELENFVLPSMANLSGDYSLLAGRIQDITDEEAELLLLEKLAAFEKKNKPEV